jgi:hypothetical protein
MTQPQIANRKSLIANLRSQAPNLLFAVVFIGACLVRFWQITQIPNTLWVDEAWFALRARDVVRGLNYIPITRPGLGTGDSPLQVYLAAIIQMLGLSVPYASRIVSSIVGALTIGLLYPALTVMWEEEFEENTARWMALIATGVVAGLFTHLYASRVGMQYALAPAFTVLTLWLAWRAFTAPNMAWAAGAGIALGLSQYTYEAARALPILVGAFGLLQVGQAAAGKGGKIAARLGIIAGFAILAIVPLALVYVRDPALYYLHMRDVSRGVLTGGPLNALRNALLNYGLTLLGISIRGDMLPGRNLVGRPMLDPLLSLFCWLGFALILRRIKTSRSGQLLILWLAIMLLPAALAVESPAFNRMLAVAPALAAFVALGMLWVWRRFAGRHLARWGAGIVLAAGLVLSQAQSLYDYFVRWANDPRLFDAMSMGPRLLADRALELAHTDQVYLTPASEVFAQPVYDLLLEGSPVKALDGNVCLPLVDRPTRPVDYGVMLTADHNSLPWLKALYPTGREIGVVMHPGGYAYAVVFQVPAGTPGPTPQYQARTEFAGGPTLIGYDLSASSVRPGETINLVFYWLGTEDISEDLVSFVHIGKGRQSDPLVANHDAQICGSAYPTSQWSEGEIIMDSHTLVIAGDAPADTYEIAVGLYRASDRMRLEIGQTDHPAQDNRVTIGTLTVAP